MSPLHAIRVEKPSIDTLGHSTRKNIDLSLPAILRASPQTDYRMLDIAHPDYMKRRGLHTSLAGDGTIDICPPLHPPYGALDVRGEPHISDVKYSDLYRRTLPWSLHTRRIMKNTVRGFRRQRKPLTIVLITALLLTVPTLFYTKYLIEAGYSSLESLRTAENRDEIASLIHRARGNFERANILFTPFRIVPGDTVKLASTALYGGLSLSRAFDHIIGELPLSTTGATIEDTLDVSNPYRPVAKNIYPLSRLGITEPTVWMSEHRDTIVYFARELKEAGLRYSDAATLSHPRASEIAHVGRGISEIVSLIDGYLANESDVLRLLGSEVPERYIIFNQNRDEIRANGGFPGSVITFNVFR